MFRTNPPRYLLPCSCQLKNCTPWEFRVKFYLGAKWGLWPRRQHFRLLWETAPKRRGGGEVRSTCSQVHNFFAKSSCQSQEAGVTTKDFSVFLDMRRYENWAHKVDLWKYLTIWRPVLPSSPLYRPPPAQSASFLIATQNSFHGVLNISNTWFNPCRGRWQVPIYSWCPGTMGKDSPSSFHLLLPEVWSEAMGRSPPVLWPTGWGRKCKKWREIS